MSLAFIATVLPDLQSVLLHHVMRSYSLRTFALRLYAAAAVGSIPVDQDVVTANPESWSFDPFSLTRDGDKLQGRGVTDCLGHVALMTELFR